MRAKAAGLLADLLDAAAPPRPFVRWDGFDAAEPLNQMHQMFLAADPRELTEALSALRQSPEVVCSEPHCPHRRNAFDGASHPVSESKIGELRVIAALAERSATYIEGGAILQASVTQDLQAEFLRHHANACLGSLGLVLSQRPNGALAAVGAALLARLDEDMRTLVARP